MKNDFNKRKEKIYEHIKKANYKKAFSLSQKLFNDYKGNLIAKYIYASLLGDYAETEAKNNKKMLKEKSRKLLFQLTRQLKGQEFKFSFFVRNEYFYHSSQFKKQFILGNEAIKKGNVNGYYSKGVGASNYAYELINKHQKKRAKFWANKSIIAWKRYLKSNPNYYNAYTHYALALGIAGKHNKAEEALKKAQRLSGKNKNYSEFVEVRNKIKQFNTPKNQ